MRITTKGWLVAVAATVAATVLGVTPAQGQQSPSSPGKEAKAQVSAAAVQADLRREQATATGVASSAAAESALATIQARIAKYVATQGTRYTFGSYVHPTTGVIVLDTDAPSALIASLTKLGGTTAAAKAAAAVRIDVRRATITDAAGRMDDTPPYYGGAGLRVGNGVCSAGYSVVNSAGTRSMVTAGHCWANGTSVNTDSNARVVGTVSGRALASETGEAMDMELLGGQSYSGRIFTGPVTTNTNTPVLSAGTAVVGSSYCHSGRTTGEQCGHIVQSITAQTCTGTGCKSPVIAYTGGTLHQGGDSGAPFYFQGSSGVHIRGHIISSGNGTGYVERWNKVATRYGVSIATG